MVFQTRELVVLAFHTHWKKRKQRCLEFWKSSLTAQCCGEGNKKHPFCCLVMREFGELFKVSWALVNLAQGAKVLESFMVPVCLKPVALWFLSHTFEKGNSRHTECEFVSFPGGDIREKRLAPCSGSPTLKGGDP